jgi:hypothetical protein
MPENNHNYDPSLLSGKALERYWYRLKAQEEFMNLFKYNEGDDRAIAIVGGSFLETLLEHILIEFLPEDEKEVDELLKYDKPLGTYGNKVRMCYCLGLIDKIIKDDLKIVGRIRNRFAHDLYVSFKDEQIVKMCNSLKWHYIAMMVSEVPEGATTRDIFQVGVHTLISHLVGNVGMARTEKRFIKDRFSR